MSANFNAAVDYFNLAGAKLALDSSSDGKGHQVAEQPNFIGDPTARDEHSVRAEPSVTYTVIGELTAEDLPAIGAFVGPTGQGATKYAVGSIAINTKSGEAPTITVTGKSVGVQAAAWRTYALPDITVTPRHRAQKILDDAEDLPENCTSSSATFSAEITYGDPKGEIKTVDCHGGKYELSKSIYDKETAASTATSLETGTAGKNAYAEKTVTETGDLDGSDADDDDDD